MLHRVAGIVAHRIVAGGLYGVAVDTFVIVTTIQRSNDKR
jgi:hypothetical protein